MCLMLTGRSQRFTAKLSSKFGKEIAYLWKLNSESLNMSQ